MTSEVKVVDLPGIPRLEIAPHHCFACGTLNTAGMGLDLHVAPGRSWTALTYEERFHAVESPADTPLDVDATR